MKESKEKPVEWVGASLDDLKKFPEAVIEEIGYVLYLVQTGKFHRKIKPLKGFSGVFEIVEPYQTDTYRMVYATKIGETIYVLHSFKKKSKRGIATPKQDIDLIKKRLQVAKTMEKEKMK